MNVFRLSPKIILVALIAISIIFHFISLSRPAVPIFDEAHFATYAAQHSNNKAVFDIHPPLGKLIYSIPLRFLESEVTNREFLKIVKDEEYGIKAESVNDTYETFPYVPLRIISAMFGVLLSILVYLFIKTISESTTAALLGFFFITFENALLFYTRFILLDGMFMAFGLAALIFFFKKKSSPIIAGILWGIALNIKLTAVIFFGPVLFLALVSYSGQITLVRTKNVLLFAVVGFIAFVLIMLGSYTMILDAPEQLALYTDLLPQMMNSFDRVFDSILPEKEILPASIRALFVNASIMIVGYTSGDETHPYESSWYTWPIMYRPMPLLADKNYSFTLIGNPIVWFLALTGFLIAMKKLPFYVANAARSKPALLLIGGYIFALFPFISFIKRSTFIYHYFPALIFAFMLGAIQIANYLESTQEKKRRKILAALVIATVGGFLLVSPLTFGYPLPFL